MEHVIKKVAWLLIENNKVLFARTRGVNVAYCVGGKIEPDETSEEALMREVREEASVELSSESIRHIHTFVGPAHTIAHGKGSRKDSMMEMHCYEAKHTGDLSPSMEIEELVWLGSSDGNRTTEMGQSILRWLHHEGMIE